MNNLEPVNGDYVSLIEKLSNQSLDKLMKEMNMFSQIHPQNTSDHNNKGKSTLKVSTYKKTFTTKQQGKNHKKVEKPKVIQNTQDNPLKKDENKKQQKSNKVAVFIFIFLILFFLLIFIDMPLGSVIFFFIIAYTYLSIRKGINKQKTQK